MSLRDSRLFLDHGRHAGPGSAEFADCLLAGTRKCLNFKSGPNTRGLCKQISFQWIFPFHQYVCGRYTSPEDSCQDKLTKVYVDKLHDLFPMKSRVGIAVSH